MSVRHAAQLVVTVDESKVLYGQQLVITALHITSCLLLVPLPPLRRFPALLLSHQPILLSRNLSTETPLAKAREHYG